MPFDTHVAGHDASLVLRGLLGEQLHAGHGDNADLDALLGQLLHIGE